MSTCRFPRISPLLFALAFASVQAHAYVNYNRLGYVSCAACHFDAIGGGPLTPYGQSVQSALSWISKEDMPGEKMFYHGIQARALGMTSSDRANPFLMQADYMGTAVLNKQYKLNVQFGPDFDESKTAFASVRGGWDGWVVRRALMSADLPSGDSIEAGRDIEIGGLNIDDHTSFLRTQNRRGLFDYPTQLRYVHQSERWQVLPYFALPSFEEIAGNREYGGGTRAEYALNETNSVGVMGFYGNSPSVSRLQGSGFFRLSHDHWNGFIGEMVMTHFNVHASAQGLDQETAYLRPYISIPEWVDTSFIAEYLHVSSPFFENGFQYGPEINLRLHKYISLIGDGRNIGIQGNAQWSWYAQAFVHYEI